MAADSSSSSSSSLSLSMSPLLLQLVFTLLLLLLLPLSSSPLLVLVLVLVLVLPEKLLPLLLPLPPRCSRGLSRRCLARAALYALTVVVEPARPPNGKLCFMPQ